MVLVVLLALAAPAEGLALVGPGLAAAVAAAVLVDLPILRWRTGAWPFPSGAILTGLLVAMVLSPEEPWPIVAITSAIGIASKYLVRTGLANVFNPAALALVVTFYVFDTGQSWWGALADLHPAALVVLFATGIFITHRVNKFPIVLAFLGVYYALFTAMAFLDDPGLVAELFRTPDLQAVLFFAFFMLTDPPTAPVRYGDQVVCGAIVAVSAVAVFEGLGAAHFLLSGVLAGNVWEAARRWRQRRRRPSLRP